MSFRLGAMDTVVPCHKSDTDTVLCCASVTLVNIVFNWITSIL